MAKKARPPKKKKAERMRRPPFNKYAADGPVAALKYRFANHLLQLMNDRGWNESELARRMEEVRPIHVGRDVGRDMVCHWVCGKHMPSAQNLDLLSRAFQLPPSEILPEGLMLGESTPVPLLLRTLPDGRIDLQADMRVPFKTFERVSGLLQTLQSELEEHVPILAESLGRGLYRLRIKKIVPANVAFAVEKLLQGGKNAP